MNNTFLKCLRLCTGTFPLRAALPLLAAPLILSGCSGAKSASLQETAISQYYAAETTAAAMDYDMAMAEMPAAAPISYDNGYQTEEGFYEGSDLSANATAGSGGAITGSSAITPAASLSRKLIRNVFMSVETDHFDDLLKQLQAKVNQLSGYVEQSDISGERTGYSNRYANMTARIPATALDQFISVVEENGNVTYKSESTQDVTLQYSDLESRKKTLTLEQDRIWALLEKADTLEAVIALEERLSEIRYELESMESQLKLYDNQVAYSTIEIRINEMIPSDFTPTAPETIGQRIQKGFSRNVTNVAEFFTDLFIGLIILAPVWIPFVVILLIAAFVIKRSLKKRQKKNPSALPSGHSKENENQTADSPSDSRRQS